MCSKTEWNFLMVKNGQLYRFTLADSDDFAFWPYNWFDRGQLVGPFSFRVNGPKVNPICKPLKYHYCDIQWLRRDNLGAHNLKNKTSHPLPITSLRNWYRRGAEESQASGTIIATIEDYSGDFKVFFDHGFRVFGPWFGYLDHDFSVFGPYLRGARQS